GNPQVAQVGIIPACAGSTSSSMDIAVPPPDHPRVRGEHDGSVTSWCGQKGSSPRARGALGDNESGEEHLRIIPACAGSTGRSNTARYPLKDHPRVRGEHEGLAYWEACKRGSSPRARGAQCCGRELFAWPRIIPACAGSTRACLAAGAAPRDHPRVRGEHVTSELHRLSGQGSSPRARGAPSRNLAGPPAVGIIPACAGSTRDV